jgi:Ni,Fe-hydrogenase I cytochrome b subunit
MGRGISIHLFQISYSTVCVLRPTGHFVKKYKPQSRASKNEVYLFFQAVHFYRYIHFSCVLTINGRCYFRDLTFHTSERQLPQWDPFRRLINTILDLSLGWRLSQPHASPTLTLRMESAVSNGY